MEQREISLTDAAAALSISYNQALRLVLRRELAGGKRGRRWFVSAEAVEARLTSLERTAASTTRQPSPRE